MSTGLSRGSSQNKQFIQDITWNVLNPEQTQREIPPYQEESASSVTIKELISHTVLGEPLIGSL